MGKRLVIYGGLGILALVVVWLGLRPAGDEPAVGYEALPELDFMKEIMEDGETLAPSRLQVQGDTLFVAYNGIPRIDAYNFDLEPLFRIPLVAPETILPTAFAVTDSSLVVCDHGKRIVAVFDRNGKYQTSFNLLPDGVTTLAPIALSAFKGIAYVADMEQGRILAISLNNIAEVTEQGELVLTIPAEKNPRLGLPSAVLVTPDGRLLVGDAMKAAVRVFTCDGRAVYDFEPVPGFEKVAPQGLTQDTLKDPTLTVEASWDPSGLAGQGRYHMADGFNGLVHIFNPVGRFIGSYPEKGLLAGPAGIAADRRGGRIFVSDPPTGRILVYRFKGD